MLLIGHQMRSELYHTRLSKIDIFGNLRSINNIQAHDISVNDATFDNELEHYYIFRCPYVLSPVKKILVLRRRS